MEEPNHGAEEGAEGEEAKVVEQVEKKEMGFRRVNI